MSPRDSPINEGEFNPAAPHLPVRANDSYYTCLGQDRVRARPRRVVVRLEEPARLGEELALVVQVVVERHDAEVVRRDDQADVAHLPRRVVTRQPRREPT